jgi:putative PIG3 family NAD(P)H quinone oxidoreductase
MKAIIVTSDQSLSWQEVPDPVCQPGEALIEQHYTALNRADLMQREGRYPPPPGASQILGLEAAGVIRQLPAGYRGGLKIGDATCTLLAGGGYAELNCVPVDLLMPIPKGWTLAEAAAMPEAFYTAYLNLFIEAHLQGGESVLIHGGGSGVGTAAIQLAHEVGCQVFATAGSAAKLEACRKLGATAIDYRNEDFVEVILRDTAERGVDVILDIVGAAYLERNLRSLATGGRLVVIATLQGAKATLDLRLVMAKRALIKGSTLRARPLHEKLLIKERFMAQFWSALEARRITPMIDAVLLIAEAEAAHRRMQNYENIGKLVLKIR